MCSPWASFYCDFSIFYSTILKNHQFYVLCSKIVRLLCSITPKTEWELCTYEHLFCAFVHRLRTFRLCYCSNRYTEFEEKKYKRRNVQRRQKHYYLGVTRQRSTMCAAYIIGVRVRLPFFSLDFIGNVYGVLVMTVYIDTIPYYVPTTI